MADGAGVASTSGSIVKDGAGSPWPTLEPTLPPYVHEPVTISLAVITALLTFLLVLQIMRLWMYGFRKISYFSACLTFNFLWGCLRTALLIIYAEQHHVAASLSGFEYILLFVLPPCFQFATFSMVALYFLTVGLKSWKPRTKLALYFQAVGICIIQVFVLTNIFCALDLESFSSAVMTSKMRIRVFVSEIFFLIMSLALTFSVWKIRELLRTNKMIEGHGITIRRMICFTAIMVPLYLSRSVYNVVAMYSKNLEIWGYRWTFLSDQAARLGDDGIPFVVFITALVIWEIFPMVVILSVFWVSRSTVRQHLEVMHAMTPQAVMFDEGQPDDDPLLVNGGVDTDLDSDCDDYSIMSYGAMARSAELSVRIGVPRSFGGSANSFVASSGSVSVDI